MFDVSLAGAGLAGLLSFLSPCILPIVPFYLSYLAGVSMNQISADGALSRAVRLRAIAAAVMFSRRCDHRFHGAWGGVEHGGAVRAGLVRRAALGRGGDHHRHGTAFSGGDPDRFLYRQFRADAGNTSNVSLVGAFVIGLAFAFGWTPCVGPVLAAILFTAAGTETAARGAMLLFVYGVGMTFPFIVAAAFVGPFMRWMQGFRQHLPLIEKIMGVLLIVFGILIATETVNYIANWMVQYWPNIG